jgi:thiamine kinase
LEQTLAQWRHWHCEPALGEAPKIIDILTGGISNYSIRVASGQDFVVRIDGISPTQIGLNRQGEYRTLQDAHRAGLAPCPRYFNPDLGSLVCDFLPPDDAPEQQSSSVAALLRSIHDLPARRHRLDHSERALRYEKIIQRKGRQLNTELLASREQVRALLQQLNDDGSDELVLCHNDLLLANRLPSGGQLWAIDWEYSAMGSRWYDLAVTIAGDALNKEQATLLVENYLGRDGSAQEWQQLHSWGCVYRYLELLWYLASDPPDESLAERSAVLRQRLALLSLG